MPLSKSLKDITETQILDNNKKKVKSRKCYNVSYIILQIFDDTRMSRIGNDIMHNIQHYLESTKKKCLEK